MCDVLLRASQGSCEMLEERPRTGRHHDHEETAQTETEAGRSRAGTGRTEGAASSRRRPSVASLTRWSSNSAPVVGLTETVALT